MHYLCDLCTIQSESIDFNEINVCLGTIRFRFIEYKTKSRKKEEKKNENKKKRTYALNMEIKRYPYDFLIFFSCFFGYVSNVSVK